MLKAVFFDLHGTLAYVPKPLGEEEISRFLLDRGLSVYPQSWRAAHNYVSMIDYPKNGYRNWQQFLRQVFYRLDTRVDNATLKELVRLFEGHPIKLYRDARPAIVETKRLNLGAAIITTIAKFKFEQPIQPITRKIDLLVDGYVARCEKSNPQMLHVALHKLGLRPQEAVMIGDEPLVDIRIPKSLGMKAILLDRRRAKTGSSGADGRSRTLIESMHIVKRWLN